MANEKRLIDADAFVEDIKTENMNLYLDGMKGTPRPRSELYDIIDRIGEQPTVDAVEVVHGRWVGSGQWNHKPYRMKNKEKWQTYLCSECGHSNGRKFNDKYCPNCGAKMDLPQITDQTKDALMKMGENAHGERREGE